MPGGSKFPAHFDGKRFFNPGGAPPKGFGDVLRWQLTNKRERSPRFVADVQPSRPPQTVEGNRIRSTLVNHSTLLLQLRGINILTDPIWSERASPFQWAGPRRRRMPGVAWEDLPPIHIVLLSHNHYDHLDLTTLRHLAARGASTYIVPIGLGQWMTRQKIGPVHELDWGDSHAFPEFTVHSVPAHHFSARGLFDRNRTLWCGYMIECQGHCIYFAGDTAFGPHFDQIREHFGQPLLAFLPIGAYEPRWFMSPVHMGPDGALEAHRILGASTSIAIHHGTFQLADEGLDTPRKELAAAVRGERFLVLDNGGFLETLW